MRGQSVGEKSTVEAFRENGVEQHHQVAHFVFEAQIYYLEIIVCIQHVEVFQHLVVRDVALAKAGSLIEDRQGVAHAAVSLFCNDVQGSVFVGDALLLSHVFQVVDDVCSSHPLEIIYLTTREDGGQNLVFLGRCQDEDDVCGRLFQRFEKGVEGRCGEHVHLVDDEYLVLAYLWRYACLVHQRFDVLHRIVTGGVKFKDVVRPLLVEGLTALALVAGFAVCCGG